MAGGICVTARMPGMTARSRRSCATTVGAGARSARGLSRTKKRPLLLAPPPGPPPADDMKASTDLFVRMTAAAACWCRTISSKETSCAPSVRTVSKPVSSVGMKPLGSRHPTSAVRMMVSRAMPTANGRCRMLTRRVRS